MNVLQIAARLATEGRGDEAVAIRELYDKLHETERKMRDLNRDLYQERQTNIWLRQELGEWR